LKTKPNIINSSFILILLGVFFIPFNSWDGLSFLGEYHRDACLLFFIAPFTLLIFKKNIKLPLHSLIFYFLLLFLIWAVVTTSLNSIDISNYFFKQTSGYYRFFRQFVSLIIAAFILPIIFYNVFINVNESKLLLKIRSAMLFSFIVVLSYSFIEILIVKFDLIFLKKAVLNLYDYIPFVEAKVDLRGRRISSITYETPALGMYLITIFAWMASYTLTTKKYYNFIPAVLVIILAIISGSRSALFIILVQSAVFIIVISKIRKYKNIFSKVLISLAIILTITSIISGPKIFNYVQNEIHSFKLNDTDHAVSNKSRFGIQYALYKVFLENPIIGVGYGQQAFESRSKYPSWSKRNNWEFKLIYLNQNDRSFPPGYNLYLRLVAETGIIGLAIFLLFIAHILIWCYNEMKVKNNIISIIIFVSMIGFLLNWLKIDTFRIYGFWICLSLIFSITKLKRNNAK